MFAAFYVSQTSTMRKESVPTAFFGKSVMNTRTKLSCGDRMIPIFFYFQGISDFFANQNHRFLRPLKPVFFATFCAKIEGGAKCVANETKNGTQGE